MRTMAVRWTVVCLIGGLLAVGTAAQEQAGVGTLLRIAVSPNDAGPFGWVRRRVAIQQLAMAAEGEALEYAMLLPLLDTGDMRLLRQDVGEWPWEVARVLAPRAPGADVLLLARLESLRHRQDERLRVTALAGALAMARHPDPQVTASLASMADYRLPGTRERLVLALALAARGDTTRDWRAEAADAMADGEVTDDAILEMLCHAAPQLGTSGVLSDALWARIERAPDRGPDALTVCAFAALAPRPVHPDRVSRLREAVRESANYETAVSQGAALLAARTMLADEPEALAAALGLLAFSGGHTDDRVLDLTADVMVGGDDWAQEFGLALDSGSWRVRIGALRLLCRMGPRARALRPHVEALEADEDPAVAAWARATRVVVTGLGPFGEWPSLAPGGLRRLMLRAEDLTVARWMGTPSERLDDAFYRARAAAAGLTPTWTEP